MYTKLANDLGVVRDADGTVIPNDPTNTNYQRYLEWVAEGNVATAPATEGHNPPIMRQMDQLEHAAILSRPTREFMLLYMEANFTPQQLAANFGYQAVKAFDGQITALRNQLQP